MFRKIFYLTLLLALLLQAAAPHQLRHRESLHSAAINTHR